MNKQLFSEFQMKQLEQKPNVLHISDRSITYHPTFKTNAVHEYHKGKTPLEVFIEHRFELNIISKEQPNRCLRRWRKTFKSTEKQDFMNHKKIRRLMKKFGLTAKIRQANPYRRMMKAPQEHCTCANHLNREFDQQEPGKVFLTDITYIYYVRDQKAYLSCVKDSTTKKIVTHYGSSSLEIDIAYKTLDKLKEAVEIFHPEAMIHSDQGGHYTHPLFQEKVRQAGL